VTIWIDAQLSPALAAWLSRRFEVEAVHVRDLDLVEATDPAIFAAARRAGAVVLTKDRDFVQLVKGRGAPPQIVWITCGNTSHREMMRILGGAFEKARGLIAAGEPVVEIKA
jgi:predicted nuclease of predicted toxin-antitoxin system